MMSNLGYGFRMAAALALAATSGCGGPCTYEPAVTGTVEIVSIDPPAGGCSYANYDWVTGGPSAFSGFDAVLVDAACLADAGFVVGSTFEVERRDETSGTCTPSIRTVLTPAVAVCRALCAG